MIQAFGPFGMSDGVIQPLTLRTDARWLYINNDSPYRLLISLADTQPGASNSLLGEWSFIIRPHSDPVIPVQTTGVSPIERQLNGIADYHGHLWILPQDPGFLALNGSFSNRAELSVTAGGPYDEMPAPSATSRQTDLSSQPRVITLPAPPNETIPAGAVINPASLPKYIPVNTAQTLVMAAGDIGKTLYAAAYLYGAHISLDTAAIQVGVRIGLILIGPGQTAATGLIVTSYVGYIREPSRLDIDYAAPRVLAGAQSVSSAGTYTAQVYLVVDVASGGSGIYGVVPATVYQDTQVINSILPVGEGNQFPVYSGFPPIY